MMKKMTPELRDKFRVIKRDKQRINEDWREAMDYEYETWIDEDEGWIEYRKVNPQTPTQEEQK
jgi:hypothetical protein